MRVHLGPVGTSVADLQRAVDLQERSEPISLSRTVTVCARAGRTEAVTVANNNRRRRCRSHQPPCMMRGRVVQAYLRSGSGTYRRTGRKRCQIWACDKDIRCQKSAYMDSMRAHTGRARHISGTVRSPISLGWSVRRMLHSGSTSIGASQRLRRNRILTQNAAKCDMREV